MNPQAAQIYFRTKIFTATPEQLQMMLYDGAIRFGQTAREALLKKNYEKSYQSLNRVQKIIVELLGGLRPEISPDLCGKLAALYKYAYRKIAEANITHDLECLDEGLKVLEFQRETWSMLMDQLGRAKAAEAAQKLNVPSPDARMEASISMQG